MNVHIPLIAAAVRRSFQGVAGGHRWQQQLAAEAHDGDPHG